MGFMQIINFPQKLRNCNNSKVPRKMTRAHQMSRPRFFRVFSQTRFGLGLFNEGGVGHQPLRLPAGRNPGPDGGNRRGRVDSYYTPRYTPPPVL